jgi:hypothetical protein
VAQRLAGSVGALVLSGAGGAALGVSPKPGWTTALRLHPLGLVASFAVGGVCGAGVYAALRPPAPAQIVYVARTADPVAAPPASASLSLAPTASAASALPAQKATSAVSVAASASTERGGLASLAEQQTLLDVARSAFARSDYNAALGALRAHFRRYPKSILGEEREALEIKALAANGQTDEARARAARFKTSFPQSLLLPSLNDSLQSNP